MCETTKETSNMVVDIVKLYEEAKTTTRGSGKSAEITRHITAIKAGLAPKGVTEIPVSTLRKMVETLMKDGMDEAESKDFTLDYSTVRGVVKAKCKLSDKKCVF